MANYKIFAELILSLPFETNNLSMEKLFPTGNQIIYPRICYANEPGLMHG